MQAELDLCRRFAGLAPFKGIGESKTGSELWKFAAAAMAKLYHPLYMKTVTWIMEPVRWKLGQACPVKKRPNPTSVTHSRDVRLEDPAAKVHGAGLRPLILPCIGSNLAAILQIHSSDLD